MNKKTKMWLIIAASFVLIGCMIFGGVMTVLGWDFSKLSTSKFEVNIYEINQEYKDISIITNTANVSLVASEDTKTLVVCHEQKNMKHAVSVVDGALTIEIQDTRKWYEYIGVNFKTAEITVYLPKGECGSVSVKTSTGKINVENISAETFDFSVSTGGITLSDVRCSGDVNIGVTTGKVDLSNVKCKNFTSKGSTGNISLAGVLVAEKLSVTRSTGNVKFDGSDATEIFVRTDTGDVTGSLLTDKVFIVHTDTGRIDVPDTASGGKCEVATDTGNIKLAIKQMS